MRFIISLVLLSLLCSFACILQNYRNIDHGVRCNKIGGASCITCFISFCFAIRIKNQQRDTFAMCKIDCEGTLFVCDVFGKFTKIEKADNIAEKCQRYKMNKIKHFSVNSNHLS